MGLFLLIEWSAPFASSAKQLQLSWYIGKVFWLLNSNLLQLIREHPSTSLTWPSTAFTRYDYIVKKFCEISFPKPFFFIGLPKALANVSASLAFPVVFLHLSPSIASCVLPEFLSVGVSASQHLCFNFSLKLVLEQFGSGVFVWWWKSVRWKSRAWNTGSRCGQRWSGARPTVHRPGAFRSWELGKDARDQICSMFCTWVRLRWHTW